MNRFALAWFDLTRGLPTALSVLRKHLGLGEMAKLLIGFGWRSIWAKPFAELGRPADSADWFTRHQLEPVLLLQDSLRSSLGKSDNDALHILSDVVSQSGAMFIATNLTPPTREVWAGLDTTGRRSFVKAIMAQFENAETEIIDDPTAEASFDVTLCHFVRLTKQIGRPELAPLFCRADSVYFARPDAPIQLRRDKTIAGGDERCEFRFYFDDSNQ